MTVETPLGTGFFVFYPDPRGGPTYGFVYLVTAKHVLRDYDGTFLPKLRVRLNLKKPNGDEACAYLDDVPVADTKGNLLWFHNENNAADETVVLPLLPDEQKFDYMSIPLPLFVTDAQMKSDAVAEGDNLFFIGLMTQYFGYKRNYPVVRRGTLALMTDEEIPTFVGPQKVFISELQSWPGNSGSPVFLNLGGVRGGSLLLGQKLSLLGFVLGAYKNKMVTAVIGEQNEALTSGNEFPIGVSLIVPATRIRDLLDSRAAQSKRDAEIGRLGPHFGP